MRKATFYTGYAEIKTFEGPKWIKDIKVDDLVWTSQKRYKKVKGVYKEMVVSLQSKVYDLYYHIEREDGSYEDRGIHRITGDSKVTLASGRSCEVNKVRSGSILRVEGDLRGKVYSRLMIAPTNYPDFSYSIEIEGNEGYYVDNVLVGL